MRVGQLSMAVDQIRKPFYNSPPPGNISYPVQIKGTIERWKRHIAPPLSPPESRTKSCAVCFRLNLR